MENTSQQYSKEQETDLLELIGKLWKGRRFIIKWCIIGAVIGLIVGFSLPKKYKSHVAFAPETEVKIGSGVSSVASMMGINLNNSIDAISVEMYPDVLHSTPFIYGLFDVPVEFERKDSTISTTLLNYMMNYQKQPWWNHILSAPFKALGWLASLNDKEEEEDATVCLDPTNLPKKEREVVKFFANNIEVFLDKKTSKISISLELQDPLVVSAAMNAIVDNLKQFMSDYRTSKARQDVANLTQICEDRKAEYQKAQKAYAEYADANQNVIRQSASIEMERLQQEMNLAYQVYSQVAAQLEGARIQEQQAKPVFVIIDPVMTPVKKSAPSKAKLLIVFTFLTGCCAAAWVLFGKDYWTRLKESI